MEVKNKVKLLTLLLVLGVSICLLTVPGCRPDRSALPNVVVIVIDTLRADHLPFYGYPKNTAPFLAKLASQGVLFEKAYATSSLTGPSTASLFTSFYPFQHGVVLNIGGTIKLRKMAPKLKVKLNKIPQEITTLGEIFKKVGYSTYGVSDNINIGDKEAFDQGFDKFSTFTYRGASAINQKVKEWADEIRSRERYFLYLHYMDPHQPYFERKPWYQKQDNPRDNQVAMYDSEINYTDQHIRELHELFNWSENTLIVVTSDHGEELWDHGLKGHGYSLFREVIHVPLMFYYPNGQFSTGTIKENVSLIDVLPTLNEFLGLSPDKDHEGISLLPRISGSELQLPQRFLFAHLVDHSFSEKMAETESTLYENWHFIKNFSGYWYLYNLKLDPGEKYNQQTGDHGIARRLFSRYHRFKKKCRIFEHDSTSFYLDEKQIERLKTLGYVK